MYDYRVNETNGQVDLTTKQSLKFIKLFPFVLSTFALIGGLTKILWAMHDIRYSSQLSLIVDGLEEAVSELISGLRVIYNNMEQSQKQRRSNLNVCLNTKRRHHGEHCLVNEIDSGNTVCEFFTYTLLFIQKWKPKSKVIKPEELFLSEPRFKDVSKTISDLI